jgi:uncharacterized membrane protein YdjX (TVP38/TMEM64 family)
MLLAFLVVVATSVSFVPFTDGRKYLLLAIIGGTEFGVFALLLYRLFGAAPNRGRSRFKGRDSQLK